MDLQRMIRLNSNDLPIKLVKLKKVLTRNEEKVRLDHFMLFMFVPPQTPTRMVEYRIEF